MQTYEKNRMVEVPVEDSTMPAYYAAPAEGRHAAVIVLQEIFGVNTEMKRIADLLASAGYAALVINYYHRTDRDLNLPYTEDGMKAGFAAAGKTGRATYFADLKASIAWLNEQPEVDRGRIATWGFCMGGSVAFLSATMPEVKAAVAFYGGSIASPFASGEVEALADVERVQAPLFLAFGGKDQHITADKVERIESTLRAAGKAFELKVYSGKDHGFFRQSSNELSDPDLGDAWQRVQALLARV